MQFEIKENNKFVFKPITIEITLESTREVQEFVTRLNMSVPIETMFNNWHQFGIWSEGIQWSEFPLNIQNELSSKDRFLELKNAIAKKVFEKEN